jgi:hypothetical protein
MVASSSHTPFTASERASLRQVLERRFSLEDLETLAFDLGIDYNALKHETTTQLSTELVSYFERRGNLSCLVTEALCKRDDEVLKYLATKLPPCAPRKKVQVIMRLDVQYDPNKVRGDIAATIGIDADEVEILGSALGSLRLLVSLPQDAADTLLRSEVDDWAFGGNQVISVTAFDSLDMASQNVWRTIARKMTSRPRPWSNALKSMNSTNRSVLPIEHLAPPHIIGDEDKSVVEATPLGERLILRRLIWPPTEPPLVFDALPNTTGLMPESLSIRQLSVQNRIYDVMPLSGDKPVQLRPRQNYWIAPLEGATQGELALVREEVKPDQVEQFVVVSEPAARHVWIDKAESTDVFTRVHVIGAEREWAISDFSPDRLDISEPRIIGIVEAILIPS